MTKLEPIDTNVVHAELEVPLPPLPAPSLDRVARRPVAGPRGAWPGRNVDDWEQEQRRVVLYPLTFIDALGRRKLHVETRHQAHDQLTRGFGDDHLARVDRGEAIERDRVDAAIVRDVHDHLRARQRRVVLVQDDLGARRVLDAGRHRHKPNVLEGAVDLEALLPTPVALLAVELGAHLQRPRPELIVLAGVQREARRKTDLHLGVPPRAVPSRELVGDDDDLLVCLRLLQGLTPCGLRREKGGHKGEDADHADSINRAQVNKRADPARLSHPASE
jgi:hypothetical protein